MSVQWLDSRFSNSYRCGVDGEFDLSRHGTNRYQKAMMGVASTLVCFCVYFQLDLEIGGFVRHLCCLTVVLDKTTSVNCEIFIVVQYTRWTSARRRLSMRTALVAR